MASTRRRTGMQKVRITTTIHPSTDHALGRLAERLGKSKSAVVEKAITAYLTAVEEGDLEERHNISRKLDAVQEAQRAQANRLATLTSQDHRSTEAVFELMRAIFPRASELDEQAIRDAGRKNVAEQQQRSRERRK